jgi:cytosine deaminase
LREIALTALRRGFKGRIQCGHCCSLSRQTDEFALETIKASADAGVAIVVLPMCNMYLQDREPGRTPRWRGVTLVHEMQTGGVSVSLASDNTRDPFYAYGDLDMVEVMREATRILHLDHPYGDWARSVGARPAAAMGLQGAGLIKPGMPARSAAWLLRQIDSGNWPEWRLDLAALERELGQLLEQASERIGQQT